MTPRSPWLQRLTILLFLVLSFYDIIPCSADEWAPQAALMEAVLNDDPTGIERAILTLGADIDLQGSGGQTPLLHAVLSGKLHAVETLLKLGADVSIPDEGGYTIAHAAGFQGRAEILRILATYKDKSIDIMQPHADGYYPFHRACWGREQRHADTVQAFLELGVPPNLPAFNGDDCLSLANNPATRSLLQPALENTTGSDEL